MLLSLEGCRMCWGWETENNITTTWHIASALWCWLFMCRMEDICQCVSEDSAQLCPVSQDAHCPLQHHHLTNNHWDFVLHLFKEIHLVTALGFCLNRVFITLPSNLMEMTSPHQVQERHRTCFIQNDKRKKKSSSLTHASPLQQWQNGEV